jgi:hypothetical protein
MKIKNVFAWEEVSLECTSVTHNATGGGFAMMRCSRPKWCTDKDQFLETFAIPLKRGHVWPRPGEKFVLVSSGRTHAEDMFPKGGGLLGATARRIARSG